MKWTATGIRRKWNAKLWGTSSKLTLVVVGARWISFSSNSGWTLIVTDSFVNRTRKKDVALTTASQYLNDSTLGENVYLLLLAIILFLWNTSVLSVVVAYCTEAQHSTSLPSAYSYSKHVWKASSIRTDLCVFVDDIDDSNNHFEREVGVLWNIIFASPELHCSFPIYKLPNIFEIQVTQVLEACWKLWDSNLFFASYGYNRVSLLFCSNKNASNMEFAEKEWLVRSYITGTHGSMPNICYDMVRELLSDNFQFSNEEQHHDKEALLGSIFPGDVLYIAYLTVFAQLVFGVQ